MNKKSLIINYVILGIILILNVAICVKSFTSNDTCDIYEKNILKVVEIKTTDDNNLWGYATGFFVDKNGTILTNKHVVFNSKTNNKFNIIKVRLASEDVWLDAIVEEISQIEDLAKIKISNKTPHYFNVTKKCFNGESVFTIGNPNGFGLSFTSGVVSSSDRIVIHKDHSIKTIQTTFVINEGNSGGPVFNEKGELLGIISFRLRDRNEDVIQGVSFALPASTIAEFLA